MDYDHKINFHTLTAFIGGTCGYVTCHEVKSHSCFTVAFQFMPRKRKTTGFSVFSTNLPDTFVQFHEINSFAKRCADLCNGLRFFNCILMRQEVWFLPKWNKNRWYGQKTRKTASQENLSLLAGGKGEEQGLLLAPSFRACFTEQGGCSQLRMEFAKALAICWRSI